MAEFNNNRVVLAPDQDTSGKTSYDKICGYELE